MTDRERATPQTSLETSEDPSLNKRQPSTFAADILRLASGTLFAQAIAIAVTPILTRLFSPEAYGTMAAFSSILSIIQVFLLLRYDQAIVLPTDDQDAINLLGASILIGTGISVLVSLAFWVWGAGLLELLNLAQAIPYLWILLPMLLIYVLHTAMGAWATRLRQFGVVAGSQMISSLSTATLRVGSGLAGANGALSLLVANLAGTALTVVFLGKRLFGATATESFAQIRWNRMLAQVQRYSDQPRYGTAAMMLNAVSWQLPIFLLTSLFSPAAAGQYALGQSVIRTPMSLLGNSITNVYLARAATARHDGTLSSLTENVFKRLLLFGLPPTLFLFLAAQDVFSLLFGAEWSDAGRYVQILSFWSLIWFICSPISQLQVVLERQQFFLYWNLINFVTRALSLWIGAQHESVVLGLLLFAASGVVMYGFLVLYLMNAAGVGTQAIIGIVFAQVLPYVPAPILMFVLHQFGIGLVMQLVLIIASILMAFLYSVRHDPVALRYWRKLQWLPRDS